MTQTAKILTVGSTKLALTQGAGRLVATRGAGYDSTPLSGYSSATARVRYVARRGATALKLRYGNWYWTAHVDVRGDNPIAVKCAIEYPFSADPASPGTIYPVAWNGSRTRTLLPGETAESDAVAGLTVSAGDAFGVRCYYSSTAAAPTFPTCLATDSFGQGVVPGSDLCDSGTVNPNSSFAYTPCAILGTPDQASPPSLLYLGDSIAAGYGDDDPFLFDRRGWIYRAINTLSVQIPYAHTALGGHKLSDETAAGHKYRLQLYPYAKHYLCQLGINDWIGGATLAAMKSAAQALWALATAAGATPWHSTLGPYTTSTDAYATLANQTVTGGDAVRTGFNDWLRDTTHWAADGLAGIFEVADACESARNSGKWAVSGGTNARGTSITQRMNFDEVHPNPYGYGVMAAAVDFTRFT